MAQARERLVRFCGILLAVVLSHTALAATYTLSAPASPFTVAFDSTSGRLTVTDTANQFVWENPSSGGGSALTIGSVTQTSGTLLTANATYGSSQLTLTFALLPATSEMTVTIGGTAANLGSALVYPYPFFPVDGSGYAVVPIDSGYVVPTSDTTFSPPVGQRCMEWYGGVDANIVGAWMGIVDTPDDYELVVTTGVIGGQTVLGSAPSWLGSNNNPGHTTNLLSYPRTVRLRFPTSGGYVGIAKQFRQQAATLGWLTTLKQKQQANPSLNLDQFIGAPVCYIWGDGRSTALLDAMEDAGITKALIQVSVNHVDEEHNFPATGLAGTAWFDAVRAHGYIGGFYDIYTTAKTTGSGPSIYDGNYYLWPPYAASEWCYFQANGEPDSSGDISVGMAAGFAANTRLPAHLSIFNPDAYFFDGVCAGTLTEDYDTQYGHFATRSLDRANRQTMLNTGYANPTKSLIVGTEQGRSWGVPYAYWAEGKEWPGTANLSLPVGVWDDSAYPQIMVDVMDPGSSLGSLLSDGYQVPLWDLVFHDCIVTTVHWNNYHNKYLYAWDHYDLIAMLRGQAPLLNITYAGTQGLATRVPNTLTDAFGNNWSTRWTTMSARFMQTYNNVCTWQGKVGYLEMINHEWLTSDRSVQMTEFSGDGGITGQGIVVNFGNYDGAYGVTNPTWTGTMRGNALSVPVDSAATYSWSPGTLQFSATNYSVTESGSFATVTVTRTGGSSGAISATYATSNGSATAGVDYTATTGTLSWADGDATSKTFTVPMAGDTLDEVSLTFNIALSNPTSGASLGTPSSTAVTIFDNPMDAWRAATFGTNAGNSAISGDTADPAGDGISNLMKYALGLNANAPANSGLPAVSTMSVSGSNYLALTFQRATSATDVSCTVQVSSDLATWLNGSTYGANGNTPSNANTTEVSDSTSNGLETIVVRDNTPMSAASKGFIRLMVTQ
jgi:hypothetical protein